MCGTIFDEGSLYDNGGCPSKEFKQLFRRAASRLRGGLWTLSMEELPKRPLSVDAEGKVATLWAAVTQGSSPCA